MSIMLEGLEKYPEYDALWHLVAMGVLTPDHAPNDWTPDPEATRPTRIAVIDTSVAVEHPNLSGAVNKTLALDLFSTRLGRPRPGRREKDWRPRAERQHQGHRGLATVLSIAGRDH